jgi:hypothetical protein
MPEMRGKSDSRQRFLHGKCRPDRLERMSEPTGKASSEGGRKIANKSLEPENSRIIFDITTMEQAERVEESVKTGYVDAIIENIVNWIGVEEDLSDSYEKFSKSLPSSEERDAANQLHILSSSDADLLRKRLQEFEGLENEHKKRILHVKGVAKKV